MSRKHPENNFFNEIHHAVVRVVLTLFLLSKILDQFRSHIRTLCVQHLQQHNNVSTPVHLS